MHNLLAITQEAEVEIRFDAGCLGKSFDVAANSSRSQLRRSSGVSEAVRA